MKSIEISITGSGPSHWITQRLYEIIARIQSTTSEDMNEGVKVEDDILSAKFRTESHCLNDY